MSDRVIVMDDGRMIADGTPYEVGEKVKTIQHDMFVALPTPMRIYAGVENALSCPITVREGRKWLDELSKTQTVDATLVPLQEKSDCKNIVVEINDIWFRYNKNLPDVVKGLSAKIYEAELYAIVGGNGTGKTTSLSIITGLLTPYRGKVLIKGEELSDIKYKYSGLLGVLPQNPQALFVKKTVALDLYELLSNRKMSKVEQKKLIDEVVEICELSDLLNQHPYDLSGGEQQRVALAKVLLLKPKILLLDEPTKGMDAHFKEKFADILYDLKISGVTMIMVSHDIEFCAKYADRCAMFFDGNIVSCDTPRVFFSGKSFYTTSANRMARAKLSTAILAEDVIRACGGQVFKKEKKASNNQSIDHSSKENTITKQQKLTPKKVIIGSVFFILFILTVLIFSNKWTDWRDYLVQLAIISELGFMLYHFIPQKQLNTDAFLIQAPREKRKLAKRTFVATVMILLAIPLTIYVGIFFLGDRKYYFISLLIILEAFFPFVLMFESRKPQARELVVISALCAIAVAGRSAFFMLPQFKPVVALVIISGVCFGGETGFLVGAITGCVSNMFFGQGTWTPWQMFAFGVIGFLAGILYRKGFLRKTKGSLCIFGGLATFFIYGGIMNPASVLMWQAKPNAEMFISAYLMGIPFDLIHSIATVLFLWFVSSSMIEKLERIKIKYGMLEH